jgi:hypothetical protein
MDAKQGVVESVCKSSKRKRGGARGEGVEEKKKPSVSAELGRDQRSKGERRREREREEGKKERKGTRERTVASDTIRMEPLLLALCRRNFRTRSLDRQTARRGSAERITTSQNSREREPEA